MQNQKPLWKSLIGYGILFLAICLMLYYYREVYYFFREGWLFFSSKERIHNSIASFGPYAPLAFIAFQILQVVLAFIPGEFTGFIGGYLFGIGPGFAFSTIGLSLGSLLAFSISRWLGLPFAPKTALLDLVIVLQASGHALVNRHTLSASEAHLFAHTPIQQNRQMGVSTVSV